MELRNEIEVSIWSWSPDEHSTLELLTHSILCSNVPQISVKSIPPKPNDTSINSSAWMREMQPEIVSTSQVSGSGSELNKKHIVYGGIESEVKFCDVTDSNRRFVDREHCILHCTRRTHNNTTT